MPILIKGDDARSGTKAKARYGQLQALREPGLNIKFITTDKRNQYDKLCCRNFFIAVSSI